MLMVYYRLTSSNIQLVFEKYTGRQSYGNTDSGKDSKLLRYSTAAFDGGDIQLYGATDKLISPSCVILLIYDLDNGYSLLLLS